MMSLRLPARAARLAHRSFPGEPNARPPLQATGNAGTAIASYRGNTRKLRGGDSTSQTKSHHFSRSSGSQLQSNPAKIPSNYRGTATNGLPTERDLPPLVPLAETPGALSLLQKGKAGYAGIA